MNSISQPVGRGVSNLNRNDVLLVQQLLNRHRMSTSAAIQEDGLVGPKTIAAIEEFQKRVVRMSIPDGRD
ncbi:MAG: peptidoglycan-binding protein [Pirellulaceae bacterium]